MEADRKDCRILYELEYHARRPVSEIARQVKLPKQVAGYRIKKMVQRNVIRGFRPVIDIHLLGYYGYRVYLRLQHMKSGEEKQLYDRISGMKNLFWFVLTTGSWDMELMFLARNNVHFSRILLEVKKILGDHIKKYVVSSSLINNHFRKKYLVEKWEPESVSPTLNIEPEIHRIDEKDFRIIRALCADASLPYRALGKKVGLSYNGVKKRLKVLEQSGIVKSYRLWLNLEKVGRQYFKSLISVFNLDERLQKAMISFCMSEPTVIYLVFCSGGWDVEIEAEVKDEYEFRELLLRFRDRFSDYVGDYEILHVYQEIKMDYFPFDSYDDFKRFYEIKWVGVSRP